MTTQNGLGPSRRDMLFSEIERASAPTLKLDESAPKIDEADRMDIGGESKGPVSGSPHAPPAGSAVTAIVGK